MTPRLIRPVLASQLAAGLGLPLLGADRELGVIRSIEKLESGALAYAKHPSMLPADASAAGVTLIGQALPVHSAECPLGTAEFSLLGEHFPSEGIVGEDSLSQENCSTPSLTQGECSTPSLTQPAVIVSGQPRLDFIRALQLLAVSPGFVPVDTPADIHPSAQIGRFVVIEDGVSIGEGTVIGHHVVIRQNVRIGKRCVIKSGAVLGEPGFGFERDAAGRPLRMPHLGGVRIGDDVEIGSHVTICRGALDDTILGDFVKLDDHVHIGHNCVIGDQTIITACAELSGSVTIGKNAWLAPNCSILNKLSLGDGAFVGIGAVVCRDVEAGGRVIGAVARASRTDRDAA